jgi:tetratricopeptide (TPR) repeat protein
MTGYSTSEVSDLLGLKPHQIRRCVRNALVSPDRGQRGEFRFDFQDVVLLRTVKQLLESHVSSRRAARCLLKVRDRLPGAKSLSGVRVFAQDNAVVVSEQNRVWDAESGQVRLDFQQDASVCRVAQLESEALIVLREVDAWDSDAWYNLGLDLEELDPERAPEAYLRAIELNPRNADAYVNLGRLQQLGGDIASAQRNYEFALGLSTDHQLALYNLGTVFDEIDEIDRALEYYRRARTVPDAHYNLARICELRGDELSARRHLREYRRMILG